VSDNNAQVVGRRFVRRLRWRQRGSPGSCGVGSRPDRTRCFSLTPIADTSRNVMSDLQLDLPSVARTGRTRPARGFPGNGP